ncbi:MAG: TldD/PmbA family protein [Bacillota bacterium]
MDWESIKAHVVDLMRDPPADYLEVRIEESEVSSLHFRGPRLESLEESISFGGAVRALSDGGWGFASFNSLEELDDRVRQACDLAAVAGNLRGERVELAPVPVVNEVASTDIVRDPAEVELSEKVAVFSDYNRQVLEFGQDISSSDVRYGDKKTRLLFFNSDGSVIDQVRLDMAGGIVAIATRGDDTQMGRVSFGSSNDYGVISDLEEEIAEACRTACRLLDAPAAPGGRYTVIAAPEMAGVFAHEAFGHLSEADDLMENERMRSIMKLGRRFGGEILNIYDTGLTPGARGYLAFDDEGVRTQRTDLIREGVLMGRLHSRQSAAMMGEKPTGSARALSYRFPPICRMRNTCIEPGEATFEDMLKGVRRGLYVVTPYGGQTDDEMFTFMAGKSFLIEDGKLGPMVRDVSLTGNVFQTLKQIDMIGSEMSTRDSAGGCGKGEQSPLPTSMWAPHIRINEVVVGGERG